MKTRSITAIFIAIVYIGTVLLSIYVHNIIFDVFVVMVAVAAAIELCRALGKKFSKPIDLFVIIYLFIGYLAFFFISEYLDPLLAISGYFIALVVMAAICFIYCAASKSKVTGNAVSTLAAMIYPVTIMAYMLGINYLDVRVTAILLMFLISVFTDTFAYLVGSLIKGPKLCPKISPKKTISGAIGGLIGGIGGAMLVYMFAKFNWLKAEMLGGGSISPIIHFIMIGLLGSVMDQIGDLVASYIKRRCDIKDYGSFMPGHGGVLDRIDGMMFTAISVYIYAVCLML